MYPIILTVFDNIEGKIGQLTVRRTSSFITKNRIAVRRASPYISEKSSNISRKLLSLSIGVTKVNFM